jgi:hypothetical protein
MLNFQFLPPSSAVIIMFALKLAALNFNSLRCVQWDLEGNNTEDRYGEAS